MPIYEDQVVDGKKGCAHCADVFEERQSMSDAPLAACPRCGAPVRRLISRTGISTQQSTRSVLSDKNLKSHGFTKLVNEGGGKFRKI